MDQLQRFVSQVRSRLLAILLLNNLLILADWWLSNEVFRLTGYWLILAIMVAPILSVTVLPWLSATYLTQPIKLLWQAILHIAPDTTGVAAPDLKSAKLGRELVTNLVAHIYQLANVAENVERMANTTPADLKSNVIANNLPLPLMVLDKADNVIFANEPMLKYIERANADVVGQSVYSVLDMSFSSEDTFDRWLTLARQKTVTAAKTWERVRLNRTDKDVLFFDLATYYNKANPEHVETMLVIFDHTLQYSQDNQAMSFVALAVHELRSPLMLLRGYIEALNEELAGKTGPEVLQFLQRMDASAQQLSAFVNNILNVARIEDDQFELQLHEENWTEIVRAAVDGLKLRAQVRGIEIECKVADNLPSVGVDRVSIYEVLSNLVDNAIKYSGDSKRIIVSSELTKDGLVETTVEDFGVGIPEAIIPNLFTKFYRSHRNRAQIGGTGLGLYLAKTIVAAQGGNIWVRSREGDGTTFGFTVLPYAHVTASQKSKTSEDITRSAHGWIKNHSLYRR